MKGCVRPSWRPACRLRRQLNKRQAMQSPKKFIGFGPIVAVLTAGFTLTQINSGAAQPYVYQPTPDYYHNDTVGGTFLGGAMGAITGALIGGRHHSGQDALIGAGVGAVTGNLLGRSKDASDERRAAVGQAQGN